MRLGQVPWRWRNSIAFVSGIVLLWGVPLRLAYAADSSGALPKSALQGSATEPGSLAHTPSPSVGLENFMGALGMWVNVIAIMVAVVTLIVTGVIGIAAFNMIAQYRQAHEFAERVETQLVTKMEKELAVLKETYKLVSLKPPGEILEDARKEFEPLIEAIRRGAERLSLDLEEGRRQTDELRKEVARTYETAAREIETRYRALYDSQQGILPRVLNAFMQVGTLTEHDRKSISRSLTVGHSSGESSVTVDSKT